MATVEQILNTDSFDPNFSFRPSEVAPLPPEIDFNRGSDAWTLDPNRDIKKLESGNARSFGAKQALRIEPQRTQLLANPGDLTAASWGHLSLNTPLPTGSDKGRTYTTIREDSTNNIHGVGQGIAPGADNIVAYTALVRPNGRNWVVLEAEMTDGTTTDVPHISFDIANRNPGSTANLSGATVLDHDVLDYGGDWSLCVAIMKPPSGFEFVRHDFFLADGDNSFNYQGDGSSGVDCLYLQATQGKFATTPIFEPESTRNDDTVTVEADNYTLNDEGWTIYMEFIIQSTNIGIFPNIVTHTKSNAKLEIDASVGGESLPTSVHYYNGSSFPISGGGFTNKIQPYSKAKLAWSQFDDKAFVAQNGGVQEGSASAVDILEYPNSNLSINGDKLVPMDLISISIEPKTRSKADLETLTSVV